MKRILPGLPSLLVLLWSLPLTADEPTHSWLQWRGPDRAGRSSEQGLHFQWAEHPPRLLWISEGLGKGYASVSVADETIYTTGNLPQGQAVIAVDAATGAVRWSQVIADQPPRHGYDGSRCTPSLDGDRLYAVSSNGAIACLQRDDGAIVWQRDFQQSWKGRMMSGWGFSESPLVDEDRVVITPGGPGATLVALNKSDGSEIWRSAVPDDPAAAYASMVISRAAGVKQCVQLVSTGLIGVRASDGMSLWYYDKIANGTANIPTPLVHDDFVFGSTGYGGGSALIQLRPKGDREIQSQEVYFLEAQKLQNHHGGLVLADGYVYGGHKHNNGFPICVELATGQVKWGGDTRGPGEGSAAVLLVGEHLIFRYQTGEVASIRATPAGYELVGVFKPEYQEGNSWAHPVVVNGRLYLREQDKLMCYDLRN